MQLSRFGLTNVLEIGIDYIIEEFIDFQHIPLSLEQLATLLRDIHSAQSFEGYLVHGDYSTGNTTLYEGEPCCFDYEYAHFGRDEFDAYRDIGRVVLRSCSNMVEADNFFCIYAGSRPDNDSLREGFSRFCDWQHAMRSEKRLPYAEVPLIRKQRIAMARNTADDIITAFTSGVDAT